MRILFFDTETNGLPKDYNASPSALGNWPRMVQIGWIIKDEKGREIERREYIVKPDGFTIPDEISKLHRVTMERAEKEGIAANLILLALDDKSKTCDFIVGHNIKFDLMIVLSEMIRHGIETKIKDIPWGDTMLIGIDICKIPGYYSRYKWPKLNELYQHLFNKPLVNAHDAMIDISATADCYFEIIRRGIIKLPELRQKQEIQTNDQQIKQNPDTQLKLKL